jgi:hypothetical protein
MEGHPPRPSSVPCITIHPETSSDDGIPCFGNEQVCQPQLLTLSDSGLLTAAFSTAGVPPTVIDTFQLPNSIAAPEPSGILLLASVVGVLCLRRRFTSTHFTSE